MLWMYGRGFQTIWIVPLLDKGLETISTFHVKSTNAELEENQTNAPK